MKDDLKRFDAADFLETKEEIAVFITEAFKTGDPGYIAHALGVAARASGMSRIADETGLSRQHLYHSFSENGNPTLQTMLAMMKALDIEITATVRH